MDIYLETKEVSIGYRLKGGKQKLIHEHLNLQVFPGEVTCLLGLNGAGKSTLLRTLCGFQPALKGEIRVTGQKLSSYSQQELSLLLGVVLTEKTNAGGITVYDLVSLGRHPYTGFFGRLHAHDHAVIEQSIEAVGIAHKAHNFISELSDGERQKAMIAKTLAQECPIIILDEPTAFLDVTSRIETMVLLHKLATEQQKAILLSTHDLELALQMGDCLWLLERSHPVKSGMPEDLILSGTFESFFQKEGIVFDPATGKLNMQKPQEMIGVEGDFTTSYWIGNALIRNGFKPAPIDPARIAIYCNSKNDIRLTFPDGRQKTARNVREVMEGVRSQGVKGVRSKE